MRSLAIRFALVFAAGIGAFSLALQFDAVENAIVQPFTALIAHVSGVALGAIGMPNDVVGTVIAGQGGFTVNILDGCNGVYVTAILVSAVSVAVLEALTVTSPPIGVIPSPTVLLMM